MRFNFAVFVVFTFLGISFAYKPVFLIHGIGANDHNNFDNLTKVIEQFHPGTIVHATHKYSDLDSIVVRLDRQVRKIGEELMEFSRNHSEGIHLIGHSQGGLIGRAILEYFPNHNVQNFISIAAPQAGQYGTDILRIAFHQDIKKEEMHVLAYNIGGQFFCSAANYWKDPHHQDAYYREVHFLPQINNEVYHVNNDTFKQGITNLKKFVLLGGKNDGIIEPWQSTHFGFYDENEAIVHLKEQRYYKEDLFGLRTLDERGALISHLVDGVNHIAWVFNKTLMEEYIFPYLD